MAVIGRSTPTHPEITGSGVRNQRNKTKPNWQSTSVQTVASAQSAQGEPKDETRKVIATRYVYAFLGIISATITFMLLKGYAITDLKDVLLAESGILSGPLGFIIGFYFKEELEKRDG